MRMWAHFAIALGLAAAHGAAAQAVTPDLTPNLTPDLTTAINRAALKDAAFAPTTAVMLWRSSEVRLSERADGPVDSLRINVGAAPRLPGLAPENDRFDVTLVRSWPRAVSFQSDRLAFDIAPHAGFGVGSFGTQAEGAPR